MPSLTRRPLAAVLAVTLALLATPAPAAGEAADEADPLRERQWHLEVISAGEAWGFHRGDDVTVAVVDTGVQADHPDLEGRVAEGYDAVDPGTQPRDENGHGTLVAGVIAAVAGNDEGGVGVAPDARILPVRVLDADGRGRPSEVAEGIRWAVEAGADVINLSLVEVPGATDGLLDDVSLINREVEQAIRDAAEAGVVLVGAAGNDGDDDVPYADDLPLAVVGAADRDGRRWPHSNADDDTLFAPGVDIVSTWSERRYATANGTSFAAPVVSAGAALLLGAGVNPDGVVPLLRREAATRSRSPGAVEVIDLGAALTVAEATGRASGAPAPDDPVEERTQEAAGEDPEPADGTAPDGTERTDPPPDGGRDAPHAEDGDRPDIAEIDEPGPGPSPRAPDRDGAAGDTGSEVAAEERAAGEGRPPAGPVIVAWALLGLVLAGHVAAARSDLFE